MTPFTSKSFISEIIEELGGDPRLKFMRIISTPETPESHIPFTNNNWYSLIKRGYHMLINGSNESKIDWSLKQTVKIQSTIQLYRGRGLHELNELKENKTNLLDNINIENPHMKINERMDINEFNKYDKHLTILNNSNFLDESLKQTLGKAMNMYDNSAFVHQYEKYGMEKSDFLDAFAFCEQIRYDYNNYI
jgi:tubulin delta